MHNTHVRVRVCVCSLSTEGYKRRVPQSYRSSNASAYACFQSCEGCRCGFQGRRWIHPCGECDETKCCCIADSSFPIVIIEFL